LILITAWKPSSGQYVFQFMRQVVDSDEVMPMTIRAPIRCCVAVIAATTLLVAGSPTVNAAEAPALPRSALPGVEAIESIEHREMPPVDVVALLREDALREASARPVAPRFAKDLAVDLTLTNSGTWETLDDGSRLWRIRLSSPGALSINLGLDVFDLPGSASFWVQAPDGSWVQGPYTRDDRNSRGGLWTAVVPGDEVVAELQVPEDSDARLEIKSVNHGYRFFGEHKDSAANKRGSCNINVVCPDGLPWRNEIRSVARITVLGMYLCTGQLLNNTAEDLTPYLLTAQHCVEQAAEAPSIVAYWNFQSPACLIVGPRVRLRFHPRRARSGTTLEIQCVLLGMGRSRPDTGIDDDNPSSVRRRKIHQLRFRPADGYLIPRRRITGRRQLLPHRRVGPGHD
jgi:hypothetical protein